MRRKQVSYIVLLLAFLAVAASGCIGTLFRAWRELEGGLPPAGARESSPDVSAGAWELRLIGDDPPTLDPALSGDTTSAAYIMEIFSGLVKLNERLQVAPDLADRWTLSGDGTTFTFHLRDGARFHDGRAVTGADVKFSFERAADPRTNSPSAESHLGDILGAREMLMGAAGTIAGITVIDDQTVRIAIDAPKPYFLAKLTRTSSFVVDSNAVARGRDWFKKDPNGTGPFRLGRWEEGQEIHLERNPLFYDGPPRVERVKFFLAGPGLQRYENGEVDAVAVPLSAIDRVRDQRDPLHRELVIGDTMSTFYVGFNTRVPPFDDVRVRQAFSHAVDKGRINGLIERGVNVIAEGILPPPMPGYRSNLRGLAYDPARARQLLAESRYQPAGLGNLTLSVSGTTSVSPVARAVVQMWREHLGVEVAIQQAEWATFLEDLQRRRFQIFELGWSAEFADPENVLDVLFLSASRRNSSQYANATVDGLLEKARAERDTGLRLRTYQEVERILVDEAPWLPLWHSRRHLLVKPYVRNYLPHPQVISHLKNVEIVGP
ncbi:MAG: peptide ABC transporter substrate-binding protein [Chloroflexi bacterium]|nr:peptide ABC transporter substrate-binding protein [Chloroflexota bacterium]